MTKINRDISDVQLQATITNTLSNVRNAYWDYVFAVQSVDVAQQSVDLADQLVKDNQTRVEVGTMAPIDVVQAQSQAATQRQNLVGRAGHDADRRARAQAADRRRHRRIRTGTRGSIPTDRPDFRPEPIDIEAAVRRALSRAHRPRRSRRRTSQANDVTLKYLQRPDAAAGRPRRDLRPGRPRRHAAHHDRAPASTAS